MEVTAGPSAGTTWSEVADRCAIGLHPSNDLVLDDPTVSRFHCELAISGDRLLLRDLGSRNGTWSGGTSLVEGSVATGTTLVLGQSQVRVTVDPDRAEIPASPHASFGWLVGATAQMRELFSLFERLAASDATFLIEGETGTGKESVAEAIHDASDRAKHGKFVVVDCSAVPGNLLESELFGHEAGAFEGASGRRIGAFEDAAGGSLLLDKIGELPMELQAKLLGALEAREIRRVGGRDVIPCDLRVIAATDRDLRREVNRGTFRADLYYRLAVARVELPPLRARAGDIPLLVERLLARLGAAPALQAELTSPAFLAELATASWPGNVRELRDLLEQCVVFGERRAVDAVSRVPPTMPAGSSLPYELARKQALDAFERDYVTGLLAAAGDNLASAARAAGINRGYLHHLLRRHGLR